MTDWHVHVGQWYEVYHTAEEVLTGLKEAGIDEAWISSTSSARYCAESLAVQGDEALRKTLGSARGLYEFVRGEMQETLSCAGKTGVRVHPLYWVIPEVHFSGAATVAAAMAELPYEGFKLHPRGNIWNLEDAKTAALAEEVFTYAEAHGLLVLIHCGVDPFELPTKFERYIAAHPHVTVQLAHTRPQEETLYMLRTYPNTVCDTAFTPHQVQEAIRAAGFADRMRYGSDYPLCPSAKPDI